MTLKYEKLIDIRHLNILFEINVSIAIIVLQTQWTIEFEEIIIAHFTFSRNIPNRIMWTRMQLANEVEMNGATCSV